MLIASILLILAALALLWLSARRQRSSGIPAGRVIFTDSSAWGKVEMPLYDPRLRLTGKPDYLVRQGAASLPVEVKSGWAPSSPYSGHLYQLAAYCLLVEKTTGQRPPYGILHYRNRTFAIDYTPQIEDGLHTILAEMRRLEKRANVARSHQEANRCTRCGYRSICDDRL
jgi:CRISPR-associated exonuclease Cas4